MIGIIRIFLLTLCLLVEAVLARNHPVNGRYTKNLEDYEFSVPHTLTFTGDLQSFQVQHFYQPPTHSWPKPKRSIRDDDVIHLGLHADNKRLHAILWPNYNLIHPDLVIEQIRGGPFYDLPQEEFCYFQGRLRGIDGSRVALSACDGLVGSVTMGNKRFFIEPLEDHEPNEDGQHLHVVYRRDLIHEASDTNQEVCKSTPNRRVRYANISSTSHSDRYLETMIVCDKPFLEYHRDLNRERYILTVFNMASDYLHDASIGQQIDLVLVRLLYLEKEELDLNVTHDAKRTLDTFCKWQRKFNPPDGSPAHADVALLFTRQDVCNGAACEVVGQSFVGTPCDDGKTCAYCEDSGLELGLVVAHQIGHLLGAVDDGVNKSGCPQDDPNDHTPYIMSSNTNLSAIRWSECSKNSIRDVFVRGLADCTLDRPPPAPLIPKPALPGVVYDWAAQCELEVPGSVPCPTEESFANICEELRCLRAANDERKECFSLGKPPAAGTKCDDDMWCFQERCVRKGQRPETVDGDWSSWGDWSPCTRSCGRGVSYALRECNNPLPANGGRYCDGDKIRYKICNTDNCADNATSFRQRQCAEYNDIPDQEGRTHRYKAFLNPESPCSLWCSTEEGENEELNSVVRDGTRCKPGKKDVCVNGECWRVGCDNMLNSMAVEDACGTCNGDGTGCKIVRDTYTEIGNKDYATVTVFPIGVKKVRIEELGSSPNVIAITDRTEKTFYLNGKYTEQGDGVYKFGKTEGIYMHPAPDQEKLTIKGPLKEELVFKVLFLKRENVGYQYQYAELTDSNAEEAKFHWEVGEMEPCSARCGGGIQTARLDCFEQKAGKVSDTYCTDLPKPMQPSQHCNRQKCLTRWRTGKWSKCDGCKGKPGVQKRGVECVGENPNPIGEDVLLEDDRCPDPAPGTTKVCSSEKPCKGKRYSHYIPQSHLGDVWIKMRPKPVKSSRKRSLLDENDDSTTKFTIPLVCATEMSSRSPNYTERTITNKTSQSYALDSESAKLIFYPLKKTEDAQSSLHLNDNKDPKDTSMESLEEDVGKEKTYKGKEAARMFKEMERSGKQYEEEQKKKTG